MKKGTLRHAAAAALAILALGNAEYSSGEVAVGGSIVDLGTNEYGITHLRILFFTEASAWYDALLYDEGGVYGATGYPPIDPSFTWGLPTTPTFSYDWYPPVYAEISGDSYFPGPIGNFCAFAIHYLARSAPGLPPIELEDTTPIGLRPCYSP